MEKHQEVKDTNKIANLQYVNFDIINEPWNKYKLSDGSILKSKFVLINVLTDKDFKENVKKSHIDKKDAIGLTMQSHNVVGVEVPENLRGPADNKIYSKQELRAAIVEDDLDTETLSETWNSYNVEGEITLKIKSTPIRVSRTNKFDSYGIPTYLYDFSADFKVNPSEKSKKVE